MEGCLIKSVMQMWCLIDARGAQWTFSQAFHVLLLGEIMLKPDHCLLFVCMDPGEPELIQRSPKPAINYQDGINVVFFF